MNNPRESHIDVLKDDDFKQHFISNDAKTNRFRRCPNKLKQQINNPVMYPKIHPNIQLQKAHVQNTGPPSLCKPL